MEVLLKDVQARLNSKVPALKYIDEDWGQLDYYFPNPPVALPCAIIDIASVSWSNAGKKEQLGLLELVVMVADMKTTNTSMKAPQAQKDAAKGIFVTKRDIYKALHGWAGSSHYTPLIRTSNRRIKRDDGFRIYEIRFTTEIKDISAVVQLQAIKAKLTEV